MSFSILLLLIILAVFYVFFLAITNKTKLTENNSCDSLENKSTTNGFKNIEGFENLTKNKIGALLYETIRTNLIGDDEKSYLKLLDKLNLKENELPNAYTVEIVIGLLFGVLLELFRELKSEEADKVINNVKHEFFKHLVEAGQIDRERIKEVDNLLRTRWFEYDKCIHMGQAKRTLSSDFGWRFYVNITGKEPEDIAIFTKKAPIMHDFWKAHKHCIREIVRELKLAGEAS